MTEIRFYHMEQSTLDQALPQIAHKAWQAGNRVMIKAPDVREAQRLSDLLWTFHPNIFLPHGTDGDKFPERQPVLVTAGNDNVNKAAILIMTHGCTCDQVSGFTMCCEMLDGRIPEQISKARARWKEYKEAGHSLTYWQQDAKGGWQKKE